MVEEHEWADIFKIKFWKFYSGTLLRGEILFSALSKILIYAN
jgi:hypothetical protein